MTQRIGVTYLPMFPNSSAPYHMALFYDKGDGSEPTVIEFSPKNRSLGIGEEVAGVWSDLQGNRDRTYRFGPLVGDERKWRSRGNDPESNDNLRRKESVAQGDDLSAPWAIIQGTADEANQTRYAYFPLSQNSNTFVAEALARAGLPLPKTIKIDPLFAPGGNKRLTIPENGDITAQPMSYEFAPGPDGSTPLGAGLGPVSPLAAVGRGMQTFPAPLANAPSAPGGPFDWLLNPIEKTGALPAAGALFGSMQANMPYGGGPVLSGGLLDPLNWNPLHRIGTFPSPSDLGPPQPRPPENGSPLPISNGSFGSLQPSSADSGGPPTSAPQTQMTPQELPTLWNGFPIPPALREVAAWARRTAPQPNPADIPGTALTGAPGQIAPQQVSAPGQQSAESLLPPELRPLVRFFGLDDS
jgi:hypothetical protein